jgi:hypothetical protein
MTTLQWTPAQGPADIAPSRCERIEGDGYLLTMLDRPHPGGGRQALSPSPVARFGRLRAREL